MRILDKNIDYTLVENYPLIINAFYEYVEENNMMDLPLSVHMVDFCDEEDIHISLMADAISEDKYAMDYLENDCKLKGVIRDEDYDRIQNIEDW